MNDPAVHEKAKPVLLKKGFVTDRASANIEVNASRQSVFQSVRKLFRLLGAHEMGVGAEIIEFLICQEYVQAQR